MARKKAAPKANVIEAIEKWREAYPTLRIPDNALASQKDFPSLYATDYVAYLKGISPEAGENFEKLVIETRWAYSMWQKAQRDADKQALLQDVFNGARHGNEYGFVRKYLMDYAEANNIKLIP